MYNSFITIDQLENDFIYIDCRFSLADTDLGRKEYQKGHIPGAIYAHLDENLSSKITDKTGRHPLPEIEFFKEWLANSGIEHDHQIVIYDTFGGAIAGRLWFMLKQIGFDKIAILDGGFQIYQSNNLPLIQGIETLKSISLPNLTNDWNNGYYTFLSTQDVFNVLKEGNSSNIIDSRSEDRHHGKNENLDPFAGCIPGSNNIYWASHLDENKLLLDKKILIENMKVHSKKSIYHCGSGVSLSMNLIVAHYLDLEKPKVYVGSWSEWIKHYPTQIELK